MADAHDLLGRILGDQGDLAGAFDAWADALRFDPMQSGALKGIGFLYFRAGNVDAALEHLQRAADIDPDDESIAQALARVRTAARATPAGGLERSGDTFVSATAPAVSVESATATTLFPGPENGDQGVMLVDGNGLRLSGNLRSPSNEDVGDRVAA